MSEHKQAKRCDRCGHLLIYTADMWQKMGHSTERPLIHGSERVKCGGVFVAEVARLGRAS